MPAGSDPLRRLDAALAAGRRRLRLRGAARGAAIGAWVGASGALLCGVVRQIGWLDDAPAAIGAVCLLVGSTLAGAAVGGLWRTLGDRETALLLDRALGTDELLVTATWLRTRPPEPRRNAVLDELAEAHLPPLAKALPVRAPQHSRWVSIPLLLALVALLAPAWRPALALNALTSDDAVVQEGARLAERMAEAKKVEGVELPAGIEREIAKLARDMQGETLTPEEAMARLEEMQAQLDAFENAMAEQKSVLEDLEKAAAALEQNPATQQLADALNNVDMGAAGEAAKELADKLGAQSPAQRKQTAEAMDKAGKELAGSSDPAMQQAGQAMQQAAQQMGSNPEQGEGQQGEGQAGEGQQGQQGQGQQNGQGQQGGEGGLSQEEAQQLSDALNQARAAGEQLKKDEEALQRSQELNGAMEGGRQRLGGEPSVEEGESSEGGEGDGGGEGQGQGEKGGEGQSGGEGAGEGADGSGEKGSGQGMGQSGAGAGQGHTWEDEGEFTDGGKGGNEEDRDGKRDDEGLVVDDFERLYKSVRDEDAEHLLTSVKGQMDESGHIDQLPIRLTSSDETANASAVQLPASYREAAAEAVDSEQVPPGYREAVKQYFDEME